VHKEYRKSQAITNFKHIIKRPSLVSITKLRSMLLYFYYTPGAILDKFALDKMENFNKNE